MKMLSIVLAATLALGGAALAAEEHSPTSGADAHKSDKMKGPPNADGKQKTDTGATDTTGTGGGGAAAAKSTGEAEGGAKK